MFLVDNAISRILLAYFIFQDGTISIESKATRNIGPIAMTMALFCNLTITHALL